MSMFSVNTLKSSSSLLLVAVVSLVAITLSQSLFNNARLDLTQDKLYSLSQGSANIINAIETPITLTFYYSDKATREMQQVRAYAKRITELLQEYQAAANGKIIFELIDYEFAVMSYLCRRGFYYS